MDRTNTAQGAPGAVFNYAGIGVARRIVGHDGALPLSDFQSGIRLNLIARQG
ncbi:MAG: hypothetical protein AAGC96_10340 [Pseudomonadota bacterium]